MDAAGKASVWGQLAGAVPAGLFPAPFPQKAGFRLHHNSRVPRIDLLPGAA